MKITASACIAVLVLSACGGSAVEPPQVDQAAVDSYLSDKPAEMHGMYQRVVVEGERNRVLNLVRAGLVAMEQGHNSLAARTFDQALLTIEAIYGGDANAAAARGTFTAEDRKVFRGEPYERAMAFYYRGILYLMEEDYENARASFRSGILQDTLAEQEEYRQDFALLEFLDGWSSQCNGNVELAAEAYAAAKDHNPASVAPERGHNLLVLADLGHAPVKLATGEHGELLRIRKSDRDFTPVESFGLNGETAGIANEESILWQAQTRGGREFDAILEGKAQFKEGAETVAEVSGAVAESGVAMATAGVVSGNEDMAQVGGTMAIVGGIASLVASSTADATRPQADTRQWNNLPESVLYGTYQVDGVPAIAGLPGQLHLGGGDRCHVAWVRSPATDVANAAATVAGKQFIGQIDWGEYGVLRYSVAFHPSGAATVSQGSSNNIFCSSDCRVTMSGTWLEEGSTIKLRYSRPPIREIDAVGSFTMHGDVLEGRVVNNNNFDGSRLTATVRVREGSPEG